MEEREADRGLDDAGSRFPFVNLEKALSRARQLYDAAGEHSLLATDAFETWGYSLKSSGGFQTIAALKMYGLLEEAGGANEQRKIVLTSKLVRYFRDEREDVIADLRREFALNPKMIKALWAHWGVSPPADNIARSHLKIDRGLNDQAARSLLGIYKENLSFSDLKGDVKVPLGDGDNPSSNRKPPQIAEVNDLVQVQIGGALQLRQPARVRAVQEHQGKPFVFIEGEVTGIPMEQIEVAEKGKAPSATVLPTLALDNSTNKPPPLAEGWHEERLLDDKNEEIFIRYKGDPSKARYELIRDYLDFKITRIKS